MVRWKDKERDYNGTYKSFRLLNYKIDELTNLVDTFIKDKEFIFLLNSSPNLEESVNKGTVIVFKENLNDDYYLGVIDKKENNTININVICLIENLYSSSEEVKIDYYNEDEFNITIDCSNINPSAKIYKDLKSSVDDRFHVGVLADEVLCEVFDCKEEYKLSLI